MKRILVFIPVISLLLIGGCSKNTLTSPNDKLNTAGKLTLQIDKTNAPLNVVTVVAYLSRPDYDTLTASLNLHTDSSADLLMQDIKAGQWHLTVNALNDSNIVVYTGETDVTISDGITTQVSLTLLPTGIGKGSIYIQVNWGTNQQSWVDYLNNPVFLTSQNPSNPLEVSETKILYENGIYKMWYLCTYNSGRGNIWYAESPDGINWTNKTTSPVLDYGAPGSWDSYSLGGGAVIKEGNNYVMYYNGLSQLYGQTSVGIAVSADGIHWQKNSTPIITPDSSSQYYIGVESVIKQNGIYYLYYGSSPRYNYNAFSINLATSSDGVTWAKYSGNPILTSTYSWEGIGITYPSVIYQNDKFIMLYENSDRDGYGLANSLDGKNWTKESSQPIFSTNNTYKKWTQIDYPFLLNVGSEYRVYYTGNPGDDHLAICFTRAFNLN